MRIRSFLDRTNDDGFSLIELLVVVIIIGILAAIAIPQFLEQRQAARNATAVADLRNLVAVETSLEVSSSLTEDPATIAGEGWEASDVNILACADVLGGGDDLQLATWHESGTALYTWRRSEGRLVATEVPPPTDCDDAIGGPGLDPTRVD